VKGYMRRKPKSREGGSGSWASAKMQKIDSGGSGQGEESTRGMGERTPTGVQGGGKKETKGGENLKDLVPRDA